MDTSPNKRLSNAYIHLNEAIIAAIATVGGGWVILRQFLYTNRIFFTSVWGWIWENTTSYCTDQRQPDITQQSNGVGVRFPWVDVCPVYLRYQARFSIFWYIKNEVIFHLFWYQWHPIECLGQTNNIQTDRGCLWMGFVMLLGCGVWIEPTW